MLSTKLPNPIRETRVLKPVFITIYDILSFVIRSQSIVCTYFIRLSPSFYAIMRKWYSKNLVFSIIKFFCSSLIHLKKNDLLFLNFLIIVSKITIESYKRSNMMWNTLQFSMPQAIVYTLNLYSELLQEEFHCRV